MAFSSQTNKTDQAEPLPLPNGYRWLAWLFVLIVIVTPRLFDLDVFYARDELAIWPWADQFTLAVWAGDPAATLTTSDYPGIPAFWAQTLFLTIKYSFPTFFSETMLPLDQLFDARSLDLLAERRLVMGLLVSLQMVGAVWLVRRLFGWSVALLTAILMGLDPFSLTEARVLRLEMASAMFVSLSILAYLCYLRERQRRWVLLSGVMAGLGVSTKTSAGLLVPYIWLLLALDFFFAAKLAASSQSFPQLSPPAPPQGEEKTKIPPSKELGKIPPTGGPSAAVPPPGGLGGTKTWPTRFKQLIGNGLTWAGGAIAAFWLIWPAMWVKPYEAIEYLFLAGFGQAAGRSVWGDKVFFWGEILPGDPGPYFYPVALAFRTTPLTWVGIVGALLLIGVTLIRWRTPQATSVGHSTWPALGAALLLAYVLLVLLELTAVISKVDRFLLIIFPTLNIITALGLTTLLRWAGRWLTQNRHAVPRLWQTVAVTGLILIIQLSLTLPAHPYYFTYWNSWAGGGRAAMALVPIGAGEGIDQAMEFLNAQPDAAEQSVVCGASHPWCERVFVGETLRSAAYPNGEWARADYATFYISHLQRQNNPPEVVDFFMAREPLYKVELQGVTYTRVYAVPEMGHFAGKWNDLAGLGRLLGYDFGPTTRPVGETVEATVWWINRGAGVDNLVLRWLDETGYEWGRTTVEPLAEYADIPPEQAAVLAGRATLTIPPGTPPGLYFLRLGVTAPGGNKLLGEFTLADGTDRLVIAPGREPLTDPTPLTIPNRLDRSLTPALTLLGYSPPEQVLTPVSPAWLTLFWQATEPATDQQIVLRLLDETGQEVTRWQGRPGHDQYPTDEWRAGEIVRDVWALQAPPDTPIGAYRLELSLRGPDDETSSPTVDLLDLEVWSQPIRYEAPAMQAELQANFGERLTLLGYDLFFDATGGSGGYLSPIFYWQSQADFQEAFDLVLTLKATESGQVVKVWQVPLGGETARTFWKRGEVVSTPYQLEADALVGGRYHLDIALHRATTTQPEPVTLSDGTKTTAAQIEDVQDKSQVRVNQ